MMAAFWRDSGDQVGLNFDVLLRPDSASVACSVIQAACSSLDPSSGTRSVETPANAAVSPSMLVSSQWRDMIHLNVGESSTV